MPKQSERRGGSTCCAWENLTPAQQRMLAVGSWTGYSAQQQQEFMNITVAAEAIGVDLSGLTVSSIAIAGQNGAARTELNLSGSTAAVAALNSQLSESGNFSVNTFLGGLPHAGFTDNFRQKARFWSIQINTNTATGAVQIDIDRFNPACGALALIAHGCQVLWHFLTGTDTSVVETADALGGARLPVSIKRS